MPLFSLSSKKASVKKRASMASDSSKKALAEEAGAAPSASEVPAEGTASAAIGLPTSAPLDPDPEVRLLPVSPLHGPWVLLLMDSWCMAYTHPSCTLVLPTSPDVASDKAARCSHRSTQAPAEEEQVHEASAPVQDGAAPVAVATDEPEVRLP